MEHLSEGMGRVCQYQRPPCGNNTDSNRGSTHQGACINCGYSIIVGGTILQVIFSSGIDITGIGHRKRVPNRQAFCCKTVVEDITNNVSIFIAPGIHRSRPGYSGLTVSRHSSNIIRTVRRLLRLIIGEDTHVSNGAVKISACSRVTGVNGSTGPLQMKITCTGIDKDGILVNITGTSSTAFDNRIGNI